MVFYDKLKNRIQDHTKKTYTGLGRNPSEIAQARDCFISNALASFEQMMQYCKSHKEVHHVQNVVEWIENAIRSLTNWQRAF
jgi:hypothetical protein